MGKGSKNAAKAEQTDEEIDEEIRKMWSFGEGDTNGDVQVVVKEGMAAPQDAVNRVEREWKKHDNENDFATKFGLTPSQLGALKQLLEETRVERGQSSAYFTTEPLQTVVACAHKYFPPDQRGKPQNVFAGKEGQKILRAAERRQIRTNDYLGTVDEEKGLRNFKFKYDDNSDGDYSDEDGVKIQSTSSSAARALPAPVLPPWKPTIPPDHRDEDNDASLYLGFNDVKDEPFPDDPDLHAKLCHAKSAAAVDLNAWRTGKGELNLTQLREALGLTLLEVVALRMLFDE